MASKIIDTYPVISLTIGGAVPKFSAYSMGPEEAREARDEILELINTVLQRTTRRQMDVEWKIITEARCEHCNSTWTEDGHDYNGGCCGLDEANNPERLKELRELAEQVSDGTFYRYEDGKRGRVAVNWPDQLGCAMALWLDNDRPHSEVDRLLSLAKHVTASDWCTVWEDPGPSGCSLARLPDVVRLDSRPEDLAGELCSLLDDMGLLPATKQAVAKAEGPSPLNSALAGEGM